MSVKVYSFTGHPDRQWSATTPLGLAIAEPGEQVTIAVSETWEEAADAIRAVREQPRRRGRAIVTWVDDE